jgi:hypothetical protein
MVFSKSVLELGIWTVLWSHLFLTVQTASSHIDCSYCLITEGRTLVTGRRVRRCKQIVDDVKDKRGYGKLKEATLDRYQWRTGFGRGYGLVVRRTRE